MYVILNQIKLFVFMKIQLDSPVNHPRIQATATVKANESLNQTIMSIPNFSNCHIIPQKTTPYPDRNLKKNLYFNFNNPHIPRPLLSPCLQN